MENKFLKFLMENKTIVILILILVFLAYLMLTFKGA